MRYICDIKESKTHSSMISSFIRYYRFLSNFYLHDIVFDNKVWMSSEHLYQALKTDDPFLRERIRNCSTPAKAKHLGSLVKLRYNWDNIKVGVMLKVLKIKFSDDELLSRLKGTYPHKLLEGNCWHDNFWGNCYCVKCSSIMGTNYLGKLLMKIRQD